MKHLILFFAALISGAALAQPTYPASAPAQPTPQPRATKVIPPPLQAERPPVPWASGNPAFPAPAGLSEAQAHAWDFWTSRPGFKSISIIAINPAVLQSSSITLNIKGKAYVFNGKSTRYEGVSTSHNGVPTGKTSGGIRWQSEIPGKDGQGFLSYSDAGGVGGEFLVRGVGLFKFIGSANAVFMVELDPAAFKFDDQVNSPATAASGVQK